MGKKTRTPSNKGRIAALTKKLKSSKADIEQVEKLIAETKSTLETAKSLRDSPEIDFEKLFELKATISEHEEKCTVISSKPHPRNSQILRKIADTSQALKSYLLLTYEDTVNYKDIMEYALTCIEEFKTIAAEYAEYAEDINTVLQKAYLLYVGQDHTSSDAVGGKRLLAIFQWLYKNLHEQENQFKNINNFNLNALKEAELICLKNSDDWGKLTEWLNTLESKYPYSLPHNNDRLQRCIALCKTGHGTQKQYEKQIASALSEITDCVELVEDFNFEWINQIKNKIPEMKSEKYFLNSAVTFNSDELLYLENTFIPHYQKSISILSNDLMLHGSAAPYTIAFMKITMKTCKNILDSMHTMKSRKDIDQQEKINKVKDNILNFYEKISGIYKKLKKDEHSWINELDNLIKTTSMYPVAFKPEEKTKILIFLTNVEPFLAEYIKFWGLDKTAPLSKKIRLDLDKFKEVKPILINATSEFQPQSSIID